MTTGERELVRASSQSPRRHCTRRSAPGAPRPSDLLASFTAAICALLLATGAATAYTVSRTGFRGDLV